MFRFILHPIVSIMWFRKAKPVSIFVSLLFFIGILWGLILLRRILATTAGGHPFDPKNPGRLNALGWIIFAFVAIASLLQYLTSRWVLTKFTDTMIPLSPAIDLQQGWILCGLLVLVLAAIWRVAVRMAEEQSLTV